MQLKLEEKLEENKFWDKVMPASITDFTWGKPLLALKTQKEWEKSLKEVVAKMDSDEFNIFLAQVVIKASSQGFVGADLTENIAWLRGLRG